MYFKSYIDIGNLEALDSPFVLVRDSSEVRIYESSHGDRTQDLRFHAPTRTLYITDPGYGMKALLHHSAAFTQEADC